MRNIQAMRLSKERFLNSEAVANILKSYKGYTETLS
jgi:hypothetical protein